MIVPLTISHFPFSSIVLCVTTKKLAVTLAFDDRRKKPVGNRLRPYHNGIGKGRIWPYPFLPLYVMPAKRFTQVSSTASFLPRSFIVRAIGDA